MDLTEAHLEKMLKACWEGGYTACFKAIREGRWIKNLLERDDFVEALVKQLLDTPRVS